MFAQKCVQSFLVCTSLVMLVSLVGCASPPERVVQGPLYVPPAQTPDYVEQANTGSLFQSNAPVASLFTGQRLPRRVGDTMKVEILEEFTATNKLKTNNSRGNSVTVKGPGKDAGINPVVTGLLNLNAAASGGDTYKGEGDTENTSKFSGKIAVSVINVLGNGYLVVAGQRTIAFNDGNTTLRFSGVVNPNDIRSGNVVASSDVVNANMETVGDGDVSDTASRSWLQRVLTKSLTVW